MHRRPLVCWAILYGILGSCAAFDGRFRKANGDFCFLSIHFCFLSIHIVCCLVIVLSSGRVKTYRRGSIAQGATCITKLRAWFNSLTFSYDRIAVSHLLPWTGKPSATKSSGVPEPVYVFIAHSKIKCGPI